MTAASRYVPILRAMEGELAAIKLLTSDQTKLIRPLLSIPAPSASQLPLEKFLAKKAKKIGEAWSSGRKIYVDSPDQDLNARMADGTHPLVFLFTELKKHGVKAIPVTGVLAERDSAYLAACGEIVAADDRGACIRLKIEDLTNLAEAEKSILVALKAIDAGEDECHLVLDFELIDDGEVFATQNRLERAINGLKNIGKWRSISIAGTGLNMGKAEGNKIVKIGRHEWSIWLGLSSKGGNLMRMPDFGDYGLISPTESFSMDFSKTKIRAKIRYTTWTEWLVAKWSGPRDSKVTRAEQFQALSKMLIRHSDYLGKRFSYGSNYIDEASKGTAHGAGGMGNWITATTQHHIKLVLDQLASPAGSSLTRKQDS